MSSIWITHMIFVAIGGNHVRPQMARSPFDLAQLSWRTHKRSSEVIMATWQRCIHAARSQDRGCQFAAALVLVTSAISVAGRWRLVTTLKPLSGCLSASVFANL